jgi:HEPN domain-containing protein
MTRSRIVSLGSTHHLAAEKALKSLLIQLGIEVPRIHDLVGLHRLLPETDQGRFVAADLEALNP